MKVSTSGQKNAQNFCSYKLHQIFGNVEPSLTYPIEEFKKVYSQGNIQYIFKNVQSHILLSLLHRIFSLDLEISEFILLYIT